LNKFDKGSGIRGQGSVDEGRDIVGGPERLQKILSAHGVASRREAEILIQSGRVTVNGVSAHIGQCAEFGRDEIAVDGSVLIPRGELLYIMLHKPRGYVTTRSDERSRKTVMDLIADIGSRVYPVGRLDIDSEGLLLLTNDGEFANAVAHPSHGKEKTYEVRVRGDAAGAVNLLCDPIRIDSHVVQAASVKLVHRFDYGGLLRISIAEGRNRQIRKMCASCGLEVLSLRRVSVGTLELGSLKPGEWRYLTSAEVQSMR